jgi:hypothetical protein
MHDSVTARRAPVALILGILLVMVAVMPVSAQQYSRETYEWSEAGSYECGAGNWVDWSAAGSGVLAIRTGTGKDVNAFFAHDRYSWRATDVRRSDGLTLHFSGDAQFKETKATRVSGSVFEFTAVESGQPFTVRDADGNVIVRDRGSIRQTILFDTLGDDTPGGEFISDVSFRANGQHPGFEFDSCDYFG